MTYNNWINNFKLSKEIAIENRFKQLLANCFKCALTHTKLDEYRLFIKDLKFSKYLNIYNSDTGIVINLKTTDKDVLIKMDTILKVYGC